MRESEEDALESRWSESTVVPETAVTLAEGEKGSVIGCPRMNRCAYMPHHHCSGLSGSAEKS